MSNGRWMRRFARWHIWLGWLVGVPLLLWTASGVVMVVKPIEEVRGNDLRIERLRAPLPGGGAPEGAAFPVETRTFVQRGRAVTLVTRSDGSIRRYDAKAGRAIPQVDALEARAILKAEIRGGSQLVSLRAFKASAAPLDFRKPVDSWQATLADGAHVYINRDTGEIEAVRTRWWRFYDFMWGLHIMDLQTREDAHNPFTIGFGLLAFVGGLLGTVLLFRRRRARMKA